MRILITNDDGIQASQLVPLVRWAQKLGEVTVVAPKNEQSAKSHGIEIRKAFEVKPVELAPGIPAYSVDSTPADCVRYAILGMGLEFDLVISGVNRGLNIGSDILYSGTVAAVFEAARLGVSAVAFSTEPCCYDDATLHLDRVWEYVTARGLLKIHSWYNINIPANPKTIRITRQGGPYYSDDFIPVGNDLYQPQGRDIHVDSGSPELDTDSTLSGYISIMPLTIERTDLNVFNALSAVSV